MKFPSVDIYNYIVDVVYVAGIHIWFTVMSTVCLSEYRRIHDNTWRVTRGIVHKSLSVCKVIINKH
jgi:hypothetical protein